MENKKIVLFELVKHNGEVKTYKQSNEKHGVKQIRCSLYLKNRKVVVKGENDNKSKKRNALLLFYSCESHELIGDALFLSLTHLSR
jgi:hypothetical protein